MLASTVLATTALAGAAGVAAQDLRTYSITITNLVSGQPLTPPVIAAHDGQTSVLVGGAAASEGVKELAENGNNAPLVEALEGEAGVSGIAQGASPILSGGVPGAAELPTVVVLELIAGASAKRFTFLAMMICTNDGIAVVDSKKLPKNVGQKLVYEAKAYDVGTEINTEVLGDMVPPCQGLVGVTSDAEGVGASDPLLAENGVIAPHPGILGEADLDAIVHAVGATPALLVIERIN